MTKEKLIQCLSTIDAHFGKKPDAEARRAEMLVYSSVLGSIPDEIALKALPAAFAVCRHKRKCPVLVAKPEHRANPKGQGNYSSPAPHCKVR